MSDEHVTDIDGLLAWAAENGAEVRVEFDAARSTLRCVVLPAPYVAGGVTVSYEEIRQALEGKGGEQ